MSVIMMWPIGLGYIPFLTPAGWVQTWWYLLIIPLAFGISVVYKALRLDDLSRIWRESLVMTAQIIVAMIALAIALMVLVQIIVPRLPVNL